MRIGGKVFQFSHFFIPGSVSHFLWRISKETADVIQPSSPWKVEVEGAENAAASTSTFYLLGRGQVWFKCTA